MWGLKHNDLPAVSQSKVSIQIWIFALFTEQYNCANGENSMSRFKWTSHLRDLVTVFFHRKLNGIAVNQWHSIRYAPKVSLWFNFSFFIHPFFSVLQEENGGGSHSFQTTITDVWSLLSKAIIQGFATTLAVWTMQPACKPQQHHQGKRWELVDSLSAETSYLFIWLLPLGLLWPSRYFKLR